MKFFIDTANFEEIKEAHALGVFYQELQLILLCSKRKSISFHDRLT